MPRCPSSIYTFSHDGGLRVGLLIPTAHGPWHSMTQPTPPITPPITPLDVLLAVMRRRWEAQDDDGAVKIAVLAAPYQHARRTAAATTRATPEPDQMTDAELDSALREAEAGMGIPADDPGEPDSLG